MSITTTTNHDGVPRASGFSVTSLCTGVVGLCLCWVPILGAILGVLGTTFGGIGWHQSRTYGRGGFGLAIAGLVCGILAIVAQAALFAAFA